MKKYDLVIRGGTVFDGTGSEAFEADIAVSEGRIAAIGKIAGSGTEEIDAIGKMVTPGFVDIHTHYDGQITWDHRLSPSSGHGVSTAVMGNCGVGFAPCRPHEHDLLIHLMEGVEDIPEAVMIEGIPWNWTTFPEYLDAIEARHADIDFAAQIPHSALRVYVMGPRGAAREPATPQDLTEMKRLVTEGIRAGAMGVTTSRSLTHRTREGDLAPSVGIIDEELLALADGLREAGKGVFQLIPDLIKSSPQTEFGVMRKLAEISGRPLSFTLAQAPATPDDWKIFTGLLKEAYDQGIEIRGQVYPRPVGVLLGHNLSFNPFSHHPSYQPLQDLPLAEKVARLRDPELRAKILSEEPLEGNPFIASLIKQVGRLLPMADPPNYEPPPEVQIAHQAKLRGISEIEMAYDLLLERDGHAILFLPAANFAAGNLDAALEMMLAENTVIGLGDGGAHYGMICDGSYTTFMLTHWGRDRRGERLPLPWIIQSLTSATANAVGLTDRGRLAKGLKADINIIDFNRLHLHAPHIVRDLPADARRLTQIADGYVANIVSGVVTYREGRPTGALPGRLVRSQLCADREY